MCNDSTSLMAPGHLTAAYWTVVGLFGSLLFVQMSEVYPNTVHIILHRYGLHLQPRVARLCWVHVHILPDHVKSR
jgi:hypothetical protein